MVDEETGEVVDKDDKSLGYELATGRYVPIDPEELEAVEVENTHTIDIDKFVPVALLTRRSYADVLPSLPPAAVAPFACHLANARNGSGASCGARSRALPPSSS